MKNLEKLGQALSKAEQRIINGGRGLRCIPFPYGEYCQIQTRKKGILVDSNGNYQGCCHLAVSSGGVGPCSHPC